jgi:hypothetical protein
MKLRTAIFAWTIAAALPLIFTRSFAQTPPFAASGAMQGSEPVTIDEIAARIDTDVITESEVRELAAFQMLVDGRSKARNELIRELSDQWIVNGEAETARFAHPTNADVDNAYAALMKQFASPEEFARGAAAAGLSGEAIRRQLAAQLYLSRFIDFRFRPAAQADDAAVQKYYDGEFAGQLKAKNEPVPPLEKVQETIREVLVQRDINGRANQWLEDARSRLEIDVLPQGGSSPQGAAR